MEANESVERDSNSKKRKSNRTCFVPKCTTGYKSNTEKKTLFSVPKDVELLKKWRNCIPRKDKKLGVYDVVCEKHFKEECIERFYRHVINGAEVLIPRGKPKLINGAIPTEYPQLPSFYTKRFSEKRNPKCPEPDTKKTRIDESIVILDEKNCLFSDPNLPSEYWTKITFQNQRNVYAFALWTYIDANVPVDLILKPERLVIVKELEDKTALCSIYINARTMAKDKILLTVEDLQKLLIDVNANALCKGAGLLNEFSGVEVLPNNFHIQDNVIRHKSCKGMVDRTSLSICLLCKHARKQLLDKRSKGKRKKPAKCSKVRFPF